MVANMMRPEQQLLSEQLRQLGKHLRGADIGKKPKSAMWGGVATWNRENASFNVLHVGTTSEGNLQHIEVVCLERVAALIDKNELPSASTIYLFLNKAPCVDYTGGRKNCFESVIRWIEERPSLKLVLAFRKPYAVGAMTERGSNKKPEHEVWPVYKRCLEAKDLPKNLTVVSMFKERGVPCPQFFSTKEREAGRRPVEKETRVRPAEGNSSLVEPRIKTRRVGGGRQLRAVARRLDLEVKQKQKVTRVEKEQMVKRLVDEYNQQMEQKSKADVLNNKEKDIKEFDTEKRFIQKFISEEKLKRSNKAVKNVKGAKLKSFIPVAVY